MKKLLHERLRETEANLIMLGGYYTHMTDDQKEALADEIERYYIPRPRFEDGEPMDIDTETNLGCINSLTWNGKGWIFENDFCNQYSCDNARFPTPKVLDADGVEINVGDTVWSVNSNAKWTVQYVTANEIGVTSGEIQHGTMFCPDVLTHKEPDSLEKLRDDMLTRNDILYAPSPEFVVREFADRLAALIERMD